MFTRYPIYKARFANTCRAKREGFDILIDFGLGQELSIDTSNNEYEIAIALFPNNVILNKEDFEKAFFLLPEGYFNRGIKVNG